MPRFALFFGGLCLVLPGTLEAACLVNDHFEPDLVGAAPAGWTLQQVDPSTSAAAIDRLSTDGTTALELIDANATSKMNVALARSFAPQSGTLTVEIDVRVGAVGDWLNVFLDDATVESPDDFKGAQVLLTDGRLIWYDGADRTLAFVTANRWYHVKIVADIATDTADVYVDGVLALPGAVFLNTRTTVSRVLVTTDGTTVSALFDALTVADSGACAFSPPSTPSLIRPFPGTRGGDQTPQLFWTVPSGGPHDFKVQWSADPTFTSGVSRKESRFSTTGFSPVPPLAPPTPRGWYELASGESLTNGTYWWRVAAFSGGQHSAWTPAESFTVDTTKTSRDWFVTTDPQLAQGLRNEARPDGAGGLHLAPDNSINFALPAEGADATASSSSPLTAPALAFDADTGTNWFSDGDPTVTPEWVRVNFGGLRTIAGYDFQGDTAGGAKSIPTAFTIKTYTGPTCGTLVLSRPFTNSSPFWSFTLPTPETVQCVEINITDTNGAGGGWRAGLFEFRVWNAQPASGSYRAPAIELADFPGATSWISMSWTSIVPAAPAALEARIETSSDGSVWTDSGLSFMSASGSQSQSISSLGSAAFIRPVFNFTKGSTPVLQQLSVDTNLGPLATDGVLSFVAAAEEGGVALLWETEDESTISAFRLARGNSSTGPWQPIAEHPASGNIGGASYREEDSVLDAWWRLEVVHNDGSTTLHGPVSLSAVARETTCACTLDPRREVRGAWLLLALVAVLLRRRY